MSTLHCCCLVPYALNSAPSQRFRWELWAPHLEERGIEMEFVPFGTPSLEAARSVGNLRKTATVAASRYADWLPDAVSSAREADVAVVSRNAAIAGPPVAEFLTAVRGTPIVYDLDDAIYLGDRNESSRLKKWVRCDWRVGVVGAWADKVTPGNDYLADYVRRFNDDVEIVPTTVSTDEYQPTPVVHDGRDPVIGWTGSQTTARMLEPLLPTLERLQSDHDFEFLVMGADVDLVGLEGRCIPWSADHEVEVVQKMDIGLMPLPDNRWTRGKCALKALQYLAVGSPAVVSDVGMNDSAVPHGECGYVVDSESEWMDALTTLLEDEDKRADMGRAGRRHIEGHYSARAWAPDLERILRDAADAK